MNPRSNRFWILTLALAALLGAAEEANANPDALAGIRHQYEVQRHQLLSRYRHERQCALNAYRARLDELEVQRLHALQLCAHERTAALHAIAQARRQAAEEYRCRLDDLRRQHHLAMRQLAAWYADARSAILRSHQVVGTCPLTNGFGIATVPSVVPLVVPTVVPPVSHGFSRSVNRSVSVSAARPPFGLLRDVQRQISRHVERDVHGRLP